jgi:sugar phosphate isomerase/epimerase
MDVFRLIEKAAGLNAEVLQIADNMPIDAYTDGELRDIKKSANEARLELELGTKGLKFETLSRYLEIAHFLDARIVRTLAHDDLHTPDFGAAVQMIGNVLPMYAISGVALCIENHDFYTIGWLKRLMDHFNSKFLRICLDPVNSLGREENLDEALKVLGEYTENFHCKDYRIDRKPSSLGFDITGAPFGNGRLDYKKANAALPANISWIIELWTPYQADIQSTVALEDEWARESVAALRKYRGSLSI